MSTTAEPPASAAASPPSSPAQSPGVLARAEGVEPQGEISGSGYRTGTALIRRADGQMVQVGALMYALFEAIDGERDADALAEAMSAQLGKRVEREHVAKLAQKLADQGLLAGTEAAAPPKSNPLLALRWKVLVTDPKLTRRLTDPFTPLFRPWLLFPVLVAFAGTLWFVLVEKGVASATAQAFENPSLLLLVFGLTVLSAGFHEMGHASACRYGGATPGGMGAGIYVVFPAFYTDVTDSYRLPRRSRLRVDLGGLYFNALVAVTTVGIWLLTGADALLLIVALQVIDMVKQLSPIIRADGYHILADLTGVPDLFSHIGPTLRRLIPWRRPEPSALTGRARFLVTAWVLVVVPALLSMAIGAVIMLPRLLSTAWGSATRITDELPTQLRELQVFGVLTSVLELIALALPVLASLFLVQRLAKMAVGGARRWSADRPSRGAALGLAATAAALGLAWAWWPAGQYTPVTGAEDWTLAGLARDAASPRTPAPPEPARAADAVAVAPATATLKPGRRLATAMIPRGGATKERPALFLLRGEDGEPPVILLDESASGATPQQRAAASGSTRPATPPAGSDAAAPAPRPAAAGSGASGASGATGPTAAAPTSTAVAFPFILPDKPGAGDTQALATGKVDGGVTYDVVYALVTVADGDPVGQENSAYALASCRACTTVAVSFQVVLVVGSSNRIAPVNIAAALNVDCPACLTTAIATQIVVTVRERPSEALAAELNAALAKLDDISDLGRDGSSADVAADVRAVQDEINEILDRSGLRDDPPPPPATKPASGASGASGAGGTPAKRTTAPTTTTQTGSTSTAAPGSTTTTGSGPPPSRTSSTSTTPAPPATTSTGTSTAPPPPTKTSTGPAPATTTSTAPPPATSTSTAPTPTTSTAPSG